MSPLLRPAGAVRPSSGPTWCDWCETPTAPEARRYKRLARDLYVAAGRTSCPEWVWVWIRRINSKAHEVLAAPPHQHLN